MSLEASEEDKRLLAWKKERERLAKKFAEDSTLKSMSARVCLAHKAAELHLHAQILFDEKVSGVGNAEETRTLPSVISNLRRVLVDLGLTEGHHDPDEDDDL